MTDAKMNTLYDVPSSYSWFEYTTYMFPPTSLPVLSPDKSC